MERSNTGLGRGSLRCSRRGGEPRTRAMLRGRVRRLGKVNAGASASKGRIRHREGVVARPAAVLLLAEKAAGSVECRSRWSPVTLPREETREDLGKVYPPYLRREIDASRRRCGLARMLRGLRFPRTGGFGTRNELARRLAPGRPGARLRRETAGGRSVRG